MKFSDRIRSNWSIVRSITAPIHPYICLIGLATLSSLSGLSGCGYVTTYFTPEPAKNYKCIMRGTDKACCTEYTEGNHHLSNCKFTETGNRAPDFQNATNIWDEVR